MQRLPKPAGEQPSNDKTVLRHFVQQLTKEQLNVMHRPLKAGRCMTCCMTSKGNKVLKAPYYSKGTRTNTGQTG
jgi:hypothetical protein